MRTVPFMISVVATMALSSAPAAADKLGEHPAIVVKRLQAAQGYDYASKFYPHPAWLYLLPSAPATPIDPPAALAAERRPVPAMLAHPAVRRVADVRR